MVIFVSIAVLLLCVLAVLVAPAWRGNLRLVPDRSAFDRAVYDDQRAELQRDADHGLISSADFDAAQNEMARRLLHKTPGGAAPNAPHSPLRFAAVLLVPALALPLYFQFGMPNLADQPRQARLDNALINEDLDAIIAKVEQHLDKSPDDLVGWTTLAPIYARAGRFENAAEANLQIMRLSPVTSDLLVSYGEMLTFANEGIVPAAAAIAFTEALKRTPTHPKAKFLALLALKQEGKLDEARVGFEQLLASAPADAPWRNAVIAELETLKTPSLTQEQISSVTQLSPNDQQTMIASMVAGLDEKLQANGNDLAGWQKLIRARSVLGQVDEAIAAREKAREIFKTQPEALRDLNTLSQELQLP